MANLTEEQREQIKEIVRRAVRTMEGTREDAIGEIAGRFGLTDDEAEEAFWAEEGEIV